MPAFIFLNTAFMEIIRPPALQIGDTIGIVAPAEPASLIEWGHLRLAEKKLNSLGLQVLYGTYAFQGRKLGIENIKERVRDIHQMFSSRKIRGVMAVIGGYSSNELLPHLDYRLIRNHPKAFIGFSDITALQNAMLVKAGLVTFSGPCFANFAQTQPPFDFEERWFKRGVMGEGTVSLVPSRMWADDEWWRHPRRSRALVKNAGWVIVRSGHNRGVIVGGNLSTFVLLFGTPYAPSLANKILFIEEDSEMNAKMIERMLVQLSQQNDFHRIRGLVVGRFGRKSGLSPESVKRLLRACTNNLNVPVIAHVDFGHTNPMITFPIGGACEIDTRHAALRLSRYRGTG